MPPEPTERDGLLVVVSGPSGVGKDAVLARLRSLGRPYSTVVTVTTREPRPSEQDGVHYVFVSKETFARMVESGDLLEWATVYGNAYGVPRSPVREALARGQDVIVKTDVQGAATIKHTVPSAVLVFLAATSHEDLERRLRHRRTENAGDLARRIATAQEEIARLPEFDYLVVNREGALDETVSRLDAIIAAERCRNPRRRAEV